MKVNGKIKFISPDMQISATFKKRELVVTTDEQYPQSIMIEFTQDKCEYLDTFKIGDSVDVSINLGGREWVNPQGETKYFNSIKGWRIEKLVVSGPEQQQTPKEESFKTSVNKAEDDHDDLPF